MPASRRAWARSLRRLPSLTGSHSPPITRIGRPGSIWARLDALLICCKPPSRSIHSWLVHRKPQQWIADVCVDFGRVTAEPVERRAVGLEGLVERAERQAIDQSAASYRAPGADARDGRSALARAVQRHRLEIRALSIAPLQAGAVMHAGRPGRCNCPCCRPRREHRGALGAAGRCAGSGWQVVYHSVPASCLCSTTRRTVVRRYVH